MCRRQRGRGEIHERKGRTGQVEDVDLSEDLVRWREEKVDSDWEEVDSSRGSAAST
jgi:phage baseplate assembly protein gpV